MVFLEIAEWLFCLVVILVVLTQMVVPLFLGMEMFPMLYGHRRRLVKQAEQAKDAREVAREARSISRDLKFSQTEVAAMLKELNQPPKGGVTDDSVRSKGKG